MVRLALKNPYAVVVMALAILIFGVAALDRIPADLLPLFRTPAVQILTFYPGMPAEIVERDITTRLERWTGQANGVARQESKSLIGVSIVKDYFRPDIDPNTAMSQVTSLAMSDLYYPPPGTIPPMVMPFDPTATIPLALITVSSPTFDETRLYDVAYFDLRNRLQGITGVIAPAVYGGEAPAHPRLPRPGQAPGEGALAHGRGLCDQVAEPDDPDRECQARKLRLPDHRQQHGARGRADQRLSHPRRFRKARVHQGRGQRRGREPDP